MAPVFRVMFLYLVCRRIALFCATAGAWFSFFVCFRRTRAVRSMRSLRSGLRTIQKLELYSRAIIRPVRVLLTTRSFSLIYDVIKSCKKKNASASTVTNIWSSNSVMKLQSTNGFSTTFNETTQSSANETLTATTRSLISTHSKASAAYRIVNAPFSGVAAKMAKRISPLCDGPFLEVWAFYCEYSRTSAPVFLSLNLGIDRQLKRKFSFNFQ